MLYRLNITFLRGFFDDFLFTGVSQGWSLSVEKSFYLQEFRRFTYQKKHPCQLVLPVFFYAVAGILFSVFYYGLVTKNFVKNVEY
jgi:peptidoglycan/LPS O-acetylase OafA/YrhL